MFAELPQSPVRKPLDVEPLDDLTKHLSTIKIEEKSTPPRRISPRKVQAPIIEDDCVPEQEVTDQDGDEADSLEKAASPHTGIEDSEKNVVEEDGCKAEEGKETSVEELQWPDDGTLRVLTWDEVSPPDAGIEKIAEASYAEVYRVTNERGTSIIKVIRLPSPIKAQTKAQVRSGLVDEEPHSPEDVKGELQISEWLADIPGFVVYKERYIVQGKTTRQLLETHQLFQKKMKKQDPDRAQFYPSPSRYLDDTKFLVVELGDAGKALEDWELTSTSQIWDIFFLEAIALARAEDLVLFEVR